jgi:hypothetical protein
MRRSPSGANRRSAARRASRIVRSSPDQRATWLERGLPVVNWPLIGSIERQCKASC